MNFSIDSKRLTDKDEREIFDEMFSTIEKDGTLNAESLRRVVDAYYEFKDMLKNSKDVGVKVEFSRPFNNLVADLRIYGSKEFKFSDAKRLAKACRIADSSIEIYPGTDELLHMGFSFYGFGG